ncbi:hypothetical protein [Undibacterium crateris]|uniref:hypothetical protein n=1 Tax=Undibacterium crateris TaxID=2528175 RepID=UPI001389732D|nr:hypothetical protein [Undibacterium crateris]NDI86500.1 hypothetical protein [Undibacterium crateris]
MMQDPAALSLTKTGFILAQLKQSYSSIRSQLPDNIYMQREAAMNSSIAAKFLLLPIRFIRSPALELP